MSAHIGPAKVTSGIEFSIDMNNTQKSNLGAPTENLIALAGVDAAIARSGTSYPFVSANITSFVLARWSASNNKLSMSFEGKRNYVGGGTGGGNDGYPVMYIYFSDWTWASSFGITTYDWSRNVQNNITMPDPTGKSIYFAVYHMNSGNRGLSYSRNHQVEFGTLATPFVNGTRTTAGSFIDPFKKTVSTVSGLTNNSDGSYTFNGASRITNTLAGSSTQTKYTRIVWIKPTASSGDMKSVMCNAIGNNADMAVGVANGYAAFHQYTKSNNGTDADYTASGVTPIALNQVYMIAVTVDRTTASSNIKIYVNGKLDATASKTLTVASSASNTVIVGGPSVDGYSGARMFYGTVYSTSHYGRILSSDEIKQNFQSLRGRFGL